MLAADPEGVLLQELLKFVVETPGAPLLVEIDGVRFPVMEMVRERGEKEAVVLRLGGGLPQRREAE